MSIFDDIATEAAAKAIALGVLQEVSITEMAGKLDPLKQPRIWAAKAFEAAEASLRGRGKLQFGIAEEENQEWIAYGNAPPESMDGFPVAIIRLPAPPPSTKDER